MRYETGSSCDVLQELPVCVSICLRFTLQILPARQSACPFRPEFPAACPWCLGCSDFFACSKDNMLSIHKTGSPCERLQELPVFVSICLGFTLRILSARQSACPLHPEFPAACPLSRIPWSQRLFSPAPKITCFPYTKRAAPAMCCKNCPYLFQFVWVLLCRFCLHGNRLALCI